MDLVSYQQSYHLVFAHGTDGHEWDDLGGQCSTAEWLQCSEIFYNFVKDVNLKMAKPLPLTLALFGGYRHDDFESVLSLHTADSVTCLKKLAQTKINFEPDMKGKIRMVEYNY